MGRTIPKDVREQVKSKYPGRCGYCGVETQKVQIDHIKPFANGGSNHVDNLMPSCFGCNNYKTHLSLESFRYNIAEQINRARRANINFRLAERFGLIEITDKPIIFYFEKVSAYATPATESEGEKG